MTHDQKKQHHHIEVGKTVSMTCLAFTTSNQNWDIASTCLSITLFNRRVGKQLFPIHWFPSAPCSLFTTALTDLDNGHTHSTQHRAQTQATTIDLYHLLIRYFMQEQHAHYRTHACTLLDEVTPISCKYTSGLISAEIGLQV